jgi:hypothetical protein
METTCTIQNERGWIKGCVCDGGWKRTLLYLYSCKSYRRNTHTVHRERERERGVAELGRDEIERLRADEWPPWVRVRGYTDGRRQQYRWCTKRNASTILCALKSARSTTTTTGYCGCHPRGTSSFVIHGREKTPRHYTLHVGAIISGHRSY